MITSVFRCFKRGVQVLFGHQKQQSPPLGSGLPLEFNCSVTSQSTLLCILYLKSGDRCTRRGVVIRGHSVEGEGSNGAGQCFS
jgi:hypothetical protein